MTLIRGVTFNKFKLYSLNNIVNESSKYKPIQIIITDNNDRITS